MFQPRTGTPPNPGYVANCYISILLVPAPPFSARHPKFAWGVLPAHAPSLSPFLTTVSTHRIILPPSYLLSLSQNTKAHMLPESEFATSLNPMPSPFLPYSQRRALVASKIYSNVTLICFRANVCRHHGSQHLPLPS